MFAPHPFGIRFAPKNSASVLEVKVDGETMATFLHCSNVHYAIIEASSLEDRSERLVIAYPDENCLRDLIAAPSIVGLGFESREEAMAKLAGSIPNSTVLKRGRRSRAICCKAEQNCDSQVKRDLEEDRRMLIRILRSALSIAIILLYSKNPFSMMIRMVLGGSL